MNAIVYTSRGGSTKRYAEMLGKKVNLSVFSLSEAYRELKKDSEVIYLGWVLGGMVKDLGKAKKRFKLKAIGAVGLDNETVEKEAQLIVKNDASNLFMLRGAFDMDGLKGFYRLMINTMMKFMLKPENLAKMSIEDQESLKGFVDGADHVDEKNLNKMLSFLEK